MSISRSQTAESTARSAYPRIEALAAHTVTKTVLKPTARVGDIGMHQPADIPRSYQADINIARFDLVSMRLAVLCAEFGSLSAAAKRAHCSIPAGSQRLSALESTLGKHLFIRDYRGLQVTEAGELFVRHARVILEHLQVLGQQFASAEVAAEPCVTHPPDHGGEGTRSASLNASPLGAATLRLALSGQRARPDRVAPG